MAAVWAMLEPIIPPAPMRTNFSLVKNSMVSLFCLIEVTPGLGRDGAKGPAGSRSAPAKIAIFLFSP